MTLIDILESFSDSHIGTESFKLLRHRCTEALHTGTDNAIIYFFIAEYCRAHVNLYEDQEVPPEFAKAKHKELCSYLTTLKQAASQNDPNQTYVTLNKIIQSHCRVSKTP